METKTILYYIIKTIGIILTTATVIVALFCGWLLFCNLGGMDVPTLGPYKIYVVLSDSMFPVMRVDDAIIICETDAEKLKADDIITFYAFESETVITHRIIDKTTMSNGYEFNTKGDNNNTADSFVTPGERVIGKYVMKIPQFGKFVTTINESPYLIITPVIVLMAVQFLLGLIENNLDPKKKKKGSGEIEAKKDESD